MNRTSFNFYTVVNFDDNGNIFHLSETQKDIESIVKGRMYLKDMPFEQWYKLFQDYAIDDDCHFEIIAHNGRISKYLKEKVNKGENPKLPKLYSPSYNAIRKAYNNVLEYYREVLK